MQLVCLQAAFVDLASAFAGYTVLPLEDCLETCDMFITTTGNKDIIMATSMSKMKNNAIVGNIGHFDNEIDMAGLMDWQGIKRQNIKPQCDRFIFPDGHGVIVLAEGRLLNLGCATGHPSFVMSCSFTNQVGSRFAVSVFSILQSVFCNLPYNSALHLCRALPALYE